MRVDLGLVLGMLLECLLMIYFANTCFYPRKNYLCSSMASVTGYIILFFITALQYPIISIVSFSVINFILLKFFYKIDYKTAVLHSLLLNVFSVIGEYIMIFLIGVDFTALGATITPRQSILITIGGKILYFIFIVITKRFMKSKEYNDSLLILTIVPVITIICLTSIITTNISYEMFVFLCFSFLAGNVAAIATDNIISNKKLETQLLREENSRQKAELIEYKLISESAEKQEIFYHDLKKHLNTLYALINNDNEEAKKYIKEMEFRQKDTNYIKYTDNKILNILLDNKIKECHKNNVEIHIHTYYPNMSFISEWDTVAVFSNLLDNAIEAAQCSAEKQIFVDFYMVNKIYIAVKVENSADVEPIVIDGILKTKKSDKSLHGIGIRSIKKSLVNYHGKLEWEYDRKHKLFRTVALFKPTI